MWYSGAIYSFTHYAPPWKRLYHKHFKYILAQLYYIQGVLGAYASPVRKIRNFFLYRPSFCPGKQPRIESNKRDSEFVRLWSDQKTKRQSRGHVPQFPIAGDANASIFFPLNYRRRGLIRIRRPINSFSCFLACYNRYAQWHKCWRPGYVSK